MRCWCGATPRRGARTAGTLETVSRSIVEERQLLDPIRNVADALIDTSNFNVHELRAHIQARFGHQDESKQLLVSCLSFGFKNGVPLDADMVFRCAVLAQSALCSGVSREDRPRPPGGRVCARISSDRGVSRPGDEADALSAAHYVEEGKSYLTVAFGCTGGQHRSVMMAEEIGKRLKKAGYRVKALHRDMVR